MCVEKTPWELVTEFHGHTCPGIALGYRLAQIAQRELGIRPTVEAETIVKAHTLSCAVDAFQVLNKATTGRRSLIIEEKGQHVYEFHYTGTQEIHRFTITPAVLERLLLPNNPELSPRERQNKTLECVQYILTLPETEFCQYEKLSGALTKV